MPTARGILERFCDRRAREVPHTLVFAPHPDDEVIGLGGQFLDRAAELEVVYVSDGAPENPVFYRPLGFAERRDYALARKKEALRALALAGVSPNRVHELRALDQAVANDLPRVIALAAELIAGRRPAAVLSPPYEGGHPDHDATALAVHAALALLARAGAPVPALLEYTSYHVTGGGLEFGSFLGASGGDVIELELAEAERALKRRMLDCHATQEVVWRGLEIRVERFRCAPRYDFRNPPAAPFHYDRVDWGCNGEQFLTRARHVLAELGIQEPC